MDHQHQGQFAFGIGRFCQQAANFAVAVRRRNLQITGFDARVVVGDLFRLRKARIQRLQQRFGAQAEQGVFGDRG
ncbi:hypothetical protein [Methylomonas koyamae]|uniref:hypothetical protein n=1 Tax=Methylomonas koyamae TaxID=702114 RepID=UPI00210F47FF|nr:hypothetical protein [Methylomonas koyamae]